MKVILRILIAFVVLPALVWVAIWLLAIWCDTGWTDVTHDPSFVNFAAVIDTWKSKIPLRLVEIKNDLHLVLGDAEISGSKELAVLPMGTEIRIEHLAYRKTFETSYLDACGSLTAGPWMGRILHISDSLFAPDLVFRACVYRGYKQVEEMTWSVAADKLTK